MAHPNHLKDAHVLIFGGTSGIGFAVASLALSLGSTVTISGSAQPKVHNKVSLLRSFYPDLPASRVQGFAVDLRDTENLEANLVAMFDKATNKGENKIDHIAFTAGDGLALPQVKDFKVNEITNGFLVRVAAPAIIAKILTRGTYMPLTATSSFTLTGGVNSKKPFAGWSMGATWGSAVGGLARGLAVDLKPVRVNLVEPGAIRTELLEKFIAGDEKKVELLLGTTLTNTIGRPEDVAEAYAWFMKDYFVTGAVASSNGGRLLA